MSNIRHLSVTDSIVIAGTFDTETELKLINTTDSTNYPNLTRAFVNTLGEYYLDSNDNSTTEDLPNIIVPNSGVGRWILLQDSTITNNNLINLLSQNLGNTLFVTSDLDPYAIGIKGNISKPFGLYQVMNYASSGDTVIVFPGNYNLNQNGLPLKDGVNYKMIDANFTGPTSGVTYGLIFSFSSYVKCNISGSAKFISTYSSNWNLITPYDPCDITFEGITFEGPNQIIGNAGSSPGQKYLTFKNCILNSTDNTIPTTLGSRNYAPDVKTIFENCTIYGSLLVNTQASGYNDPNILTFKNCELYGSSTNTNGVTASILMLDYYGNSNTIKVIIDKCNFYSPGLNLLASDGYGGSGSNKYFIINDSKFINVTGWIYNAKDNMNYKLRNNWTNTDAIYDYNIINLLIGSGIITDSNLE